jgi:membrane associated rhomboid family serine protease
MFFLLPVGVDYQARRYPVVTFTLMGICVAIYLITLPFELAKGTVAIEWVVGNLWLIPALSHWWTYLTSLFVHEGFFHLAGNMIYLFLFGSCVEDVIGRPRFVAFYLICGVVSEFTHVAIEPGHFASEIPLGGASGAISGCIGAFLLLFLRTRIEFKWVIFLFFRLWNGEFFLPAWLVISFWFLSDLAGMVLSMGAQEQGDGVAFGAHVGGTICGLALIPLERLLKRPLPAEDEEEQAEEQPRQEFAAAQPLPATRSTRGPIRVQLKTAATVVSEAPSVYLFADQMQRGPFTPPQIQQMFCDNAIPPDALYWQEGMGDWRSAQELKPTGIG